MTTPADNKPVNPAPPTPAPPVDPAADRSRRENDNARRREQSQRNAKDEADDAPEDLIHGVPDQNVETPKP